MIVYDLDNIEISKRIYHTWMAMIDGELKRLISLCPGLTVGEIPDEQFRVKPDGTGQIFVLIRTHEISLNVPKSEYKINT